MSAIAEETSPLIQLAKIQSRELYLKRMEAQNPHSNNKLIVPSEIRFRRCAKRQQKLRATVPRPWRLVAEGDPKKSATSSHQGY